MSKPDKSLKLLIATKEVIKFHIATFFGVMWWLKWRFHPAL